MGAVESGGKAAAERRCVRSDTVVVGCLQNPTLPRARFL